MDNQYFTREQAEMICCHYQSFVGKPYRNDTRTGWDIECIAVAPFDNLNKWLFVYFYEEKDDVESALSFYGSEQYDVILISRVNGEITFTDIRSYLAVNHIKSDPFYFATFASEQNNASPERKFSDFK